MSNALQIKATDGSGAFSAYVASPKAPKAPAVLVIQEIFGVNKNLRDICDKLAQDGYLAVCPDLFWRQEPGIQLTDQTEAEWKRAFELFQGFNVDKGVVDLKATLDFIRQQPGCSGKVGTVGFCLGGKLAYLMATRADADCNVAYYGVGIEGLLDESGSIKKPLLMHIAEKDGYVPPAAQQKIIAALKDNKNVEIHTYPGMDHAFTRLGGKNYNKEAAVQAHARTAAFFAKSL
jgi:carboxymethylenebutenolidase